MALRKNVAQWHAGLVIAVAAMLFAVLAFGADEPQGTAQAAQPASKKATKVVTDITIDDHGVRVDDRRVGADSGIVDEGEEVETRIDVAGNDLVRFGDDVIVDEGEVVSGDAVAILGSVLVNGVVKGDAVAVGGSLSVGPKGRVVGDGVAIGGGVDKEPGGEIKGQMVSVGRGGKWINGRHIRGPNFHPRLFPFGLFSRAGRLFTSIIWTLLLVLLGLIVAAVARGPVENVRLRAKREAFKMGLIGLLAEVLILPVIVLFCITIIGIPIGLVAIPLLLVVALLLGYTGVGLAVGERFANGSGRSIYWSVAMGIFLLQGLAIISALVRLPGGPIGVIGWVIAFIGWAVIYVATTVGLGSVIMTRFGTRAPKLGQPAGGWPLSSPPPPQPPPASPPVTV